MWTYIASLKNIDIYIQAIRYNGKNRKTNVAVNKIRSVVETYTNIYDVELGNNS